MGEPVNKNNNNIITPALPTANPGYPINLFFAISDIPANPAPIISKHNDKWYKVSTKVV